MSKFKKWWDYNGGITIFLTIIVLAVLTGLYIGVYPTYSRSEIQNSTITWERPDKDPGFWLITIDDDKWYTYNKYEYYNLETGVKANDKTEDSLNKTFDMITTNKIQNYVSAKENKKVEKIEKELIKLKEENKELKSNLQRK